MIEEMPRPRKPHLHHQRNRHGTMVWYVRKGHGRRTRILAAFGTPEFEAEYAAAISAGPLKVAPSSIAQETSRGTMRWLWKRYTASGAWAGLSLATQRQRTNIMKHVLAVAGDVPLEKYTQAQILKGRDRRKDTASQANNFLNTMRSLFEWAKNESKLVTVDPTDGVKNIKRPDTEGFHPWSEEEIAKFEGRWPVGTRQRLALALLLYTGFRRGDVVKLGRQHVRWANVATNSGRRRIKVFAIRTEKTKKTVTIPVLPEIEEIISKSPTGDLTFIATEQGRPRVKEGFGNWFKEACLEAKVTGSAHGLRKAAATRFADRGASVPQLKAWFGWDQDQMASLYTKTADELRLAVSLADFDLTIESASEAEIVRLKDRE